MKHFAAGLSLLLFVVVPTYLFAQGCPDGYRDCGGDLCCPIVKDQP